MSLPSFSTSTSLPSRSLIEPRASYHDCLGVVDVSVPSLARLRPPQAMSHRLRHDSHLIRQHHLPRAPMTSIQLPEDVWRYIAFFIPRFFLVTLVSVNRAFYNIVLDDLYKEIRWVKLDKDMIRSLARLQTPSIAARVRRLHVRAWFINYLNQKEVLTLGSYVATSRQWMARHVRFSSALSTTGKFPTADRILASMTEAARLMTGVTEYDFEWRDLAPTPVTMRFLAAARAAFGVSLRKLCLRAQLAYFSSLLSTVDFDNLEELELFFDYDHIETNSANLLCDTVAPFINHFRRSLNSLTISSESNADFSPLPPSAQNSGTLSSLEVVRILAAGPHDTWPHDTWAHFSAALAADSAVFRHVQTLKLPALHDTLASTLACLQRAADTLTSLYLSDYFMGHSDFVALIQVFAHRPLDAGLQALHVGLSCMSVEVLDLLSRRAPGLRKLYLVLTRSAVVVTACSRHYDNATAFCVALGNRLYHDWKLDDLGIWEKRFTDTQISTTEENRLMEHLAFRIPSVRMLKGEPLVYKTRPCDAWESTRDA
ncbi:hypothetical protein GGX14DRAFT_627588 [Mycena pura]|uniref:F-box domain-containing protein n=1 Tax=Mycena pura TaxID=153505 RepID=A0AAD6YR86_9AGAR|nr:hypothetical protein GGX14DRAFT_627588 [Mycena pura]